VVDLNIPMLSIVYRGTVIEIFLDLFGARNIACLWGDRKFASRDWFRFLKRHRVGFQMRLH
jgi:hypothetical protein